MAKSKLTPELRATICDLLAAGNTDKVVYEAVGISHTAFYEWLKKGEQARSGKYAEFTEAVTRARASALQDSVQAVREAIQGKLQTVEEYTELVTETLLDRSGRPVLDRDGRPMKRSYEKTFRKVIRHAKDAKYAIEYLKRRDAENWSEKINTEQHITIEGAVETAADEFERIIRERVRSESVAGEPDDTAKGGSTV